MAISINDFLGIEGLIGTADSKSFNGISGLQGGVSAALLLRRLRALVPAGRDLVSLAVRFIRPLDTTIAIDAESVKNGSVMSAVNASAFVDGKIGLQASAVFTAPQDEKTPVIAPNMPSPVTPLKEAEDFSAPPEFGPVGQRMEVRPAMPILPYSGADIPVLCAWVRLKDEVPSPDERLVILVDALTASYTAVLREPKMAPTVEMSVQLSASAFRTEFDWVLVHSETTSADARGWLRESIDVWSETGVHLAMSCQLRIVR